MMRGTTLLAAALLMSMAASSAQVNVQYQKYNLPNGLEVILYEDHSTPIVAVNIWYHVGSGREQPGKSGFAHLFEHMMFQGSKHVGDDQHFKLIQEAGGTLNGSTNTDRTNYWEVAPSNFLEMLLWLESDRMGFLLDAMTQEKLNNQRDVVKNERRQNYENRPYGLAGKIIMENLFPPDHPYHWQTIGTQEDLSNASMEDVKEFFRRWYGPNNASLCIGGDFDPAQARRWVEKYFGDLPRGPEVARFTVWMPEIFQEKRLLMEDRVQLPRLYMAWITPPAFAKDDAELALLAEVLAGGKNSRLYRTLVYDKKIAQEVNAFQGAREMASIFQIMTTAKPGFALPVIESAILDELERVRSEGVTQRELERAQNQREAQFIYALQSVGGFGGVTDQLNAYNILRGDPGYFNENLLRYKSISTDDLKRVARRYLLLDQRVVLSVVPKGKSELSAGKTE
ncbi:MAG: insulinase family protein [candidate division KSB1 bacterium]|nr:insulinase family protein [candidate division KSB1 bacterium]MDZ7302068.1 insulinase family protein [candidate division KSB1 bacterium]MDZ7311110.1 insulinase family protein [candidate division KSB1 bacterium]